MADNYHLIIDMSTYGSDELVPVTRRILQEVFVVAQSAYDRHDPQILKIWCDTSHEQLTQEARTHTWISEDEWLGRVLFNVALKGLQGEPLPECIDIED